MRSNQHSIFDEPQTEEEIFASKVNSFREMCLGNTNDANLVNYFVDHFDTLLKHVFILGPTDKKMHSFCTSILFVERKVIRQQFQQRTNYFQFVLEYPKNIRKYTSPSHAAFFSSLQRIIVDQEKQQFFPQFLNPQFFEEIVNNIDIAPAFEFLASFPKTLNDELKFQFLNLGVVDMIVRSMLSGPYKMKVSQLLFIFYVQQNLITDIPGMLLKDNAFQKVIQISLAESRPETFRFIRLIINIQMELFPSNRWNNLYQIILDHFDDYCNIVLNADKFNQCCEACINLACSVSAATSNVTDSLLNVFYKLSDDFFNNITNSFMHNCYRNLVVFFVTNKKMTKEMLIKANLPEKVAKALAYPSSTEYPPNIAQCREIYKEIDHIVIQENLMNSQLWLKARDIVNERENIISLEYGVNALQKRETHHPNLPTQGILMLIALMFLIFIGIKLKR